jgi:hypothetical protein
MRMEHHNLSTVATTVFLSRWYRRGLALPHELSVCRVSSQLLFELQAFAELFFELRLPLLNGLPEPDIDGALEHRLVLVLQRRMLLLEFGMLGLPAFNTARELSIHRDLRLVLLVPFLRKLLELREAGRAWIHPPAIRLPLTAKE